MQTWAMLMVGPALGLFFLMLYAHNLLATHPIHLYLLSPRDIPIPVLCLIPMLSGLVSPWQGF